jgi:dolichol-phosphate mannosyltransferase
MPDLLIFVPTYNEFENAPQMARELAALGLEADLLFVDDNSPDGTGKRLESLRAEIPQLLVQHRPGKQGIGSAHAETISWAYEQGYKTLVSLDCDFTHSPKDIPKLLQAATDCDLAVGSRWGHPNSLPGWNLFRRVLTSLGHALTKHVLKIPQDASGAFRAYRLDRIPRETFELIRSKGYAFFFESMFVFNLNELSIRQIPITLPARTYGHSKMSVSMALQSAKYVFELALQHFRKPERFLIPAQNPDLDNSLSDPQNWDAYWNETGRTANPAYELVAGIYRRLVIKRNLERVISREFTQGATLLHAGCGSGQVDTKIQTTHRITALDISKGALSLYSRNNRKAQEIIHGSILELPFSDECFDGIYNLGVMEHFTQAEIIRIFQSFHRVLKPEGKLVLFWPHEKAPSVIFLKLCKAFLEFFSEGAPEFHPPEISLLSSRRDVEGMLALSGLRLAEFAITPRDLWIQAVLVCEKIDGPK